MVMGVSRRGAGSIVLVLSVAIVVGVIAAGASGAASGATAEEAVFGADDTASNETAVNGNETPDNESPVTVTVGDLTWLNETGALALPLPADQVTDLESDRTVEVTPANKNVTVNGTVQSAYGPVTVDRASYDDLGIDPSFRSTGDGFMLWYPGIEEGTAYEIDVKSDGGVLSKTAESERDGVLLVDQLSGVESAHVRVTPADDAGLLINQTVQPVVHDLEVALENETLEFASGVDGLSVHGVLTDSSSQPLEDTVVDQGTITLEGSIDENDDVVLLTQAGVVAGSLLEAETEPDEDDTDTGWLDSIVSALTAFFNAVALVVVPPAVGVFLGYGMGLMDSEADLRGYLIVGFNALFAAGAAILVVGTLSGQGAIPTAGWRYPAALGLVLGALAGPAIYHRQIDPTRTQRPSAPETFTATCSIRNGRGTTTVHCWPAGKAGDRRREQVHGGTATLHLPQGTWNVQASADGTKSAVAEVSPQRPEATLTIPQECRLAVRDAETGEPIGNATVSRVDSTESTTTSSQGIVRIPPTNGGEPVTLKVSHEHYATVTTTVEFTESEKRISLSPKTGSIRVEATMDGRPVKSQSVRVEPAESRLAAATRSVQLGMDGTGNVDGLEVGTYEVSLLGTPDHDALFEGDTTTVTVRENHTTAATVDLRFTWSLSPDQRSELDRLRSEVQSLARQSGRDTAIPRYFGSTVEALLDLVEDLPNAGHTVAQRTDGPEPDIVAESLLAAAEDSIEAIHDAMTTKRIVDLFAACSDLQDRTVRWNGRCDPATVFDRLESNPGEERQRLKQRYETAQETVEQHRESLAEVGPATEMLDAAWSMTGDGDNEPEALATMFAAELLIDAVEQLFDHEPLRQRLERTVF